MRFVPDRIRTDVVPAFRRMSSGPGKSEPSGRSITILRSGLLTTIQDSGRWGHQAIGVPVSGPMDLVSHRIANALVGNDRMAASLETTLVGPEIRIDTGALLAVAGADLGARIDGKEIPMHRPVRCRPGSVLRFG